MVDVVNSNISSQINVIVERLRSNYQGISFEANPCPFMPESISKGIIDSLKHRKKKKSYLVLFTVELACELHARGETDVTVTTSNFCSATKLVTERLGYKYTVLQDIKDSTMHFNVAVGNPPFNDDQNQKANTGNYVSASKKLHLTFINQALELADEVVMVAPVRGWFVGKNKDRYLKQYQNKGLYLIENKGMPFPNAVTGEIGVFHFNKAKQFIRDEFSQRNPLSDSIVDQYQMNTMVGRCTPGNLKNKVSAIGKYKVILTSTKIGYTDDDNLFEDKSRGNWRVAFNHNGNKQGKSIYGGKVQVASPNDYLSMSMSCFTVSSEEEAKKVCEYLMSDEVTDILREIKVSNTNSKYHMSFIPKYVNR
jgi:hypothetical protein